MRRRLGWRFAALLGCALATSDAGLAEIGYRLQPRARPAEGEPAAGGAFRLESRIAPRRSPQGEGYVLTPPGFPAPDGEAASGAACFCADVIFEDDFESGDTGAWNAP